MIILFSQPSTSIETGRDHQWLPYPVNTHSPAERERTTRGCMGRRLHCHARMFERCAELDGIQLHAQRSAQWYKQRGNREDGTTEVWHCTHTNMPPLLRHSQVNWDWLTRTGWYWMAAPAGSKHTGFIFASRPPNVGHTIEPMSCAANGPRPSIRRNWLPWTIHSDGWVSLFPEPICAVSLEPWIAMEQD